MACACRHRASRETRGLSKRLSATITHGRVLDSDWLDRAVDGVDRNGGETVACEDHEAGGLLPEQAAAAAHRGTDTRLLAGPGTGKTRTLVAHVAGLIASGVPANEILCLTFTRAAAASFRRKVGDELGPGAAAPEVYTIHGFALKTLMQRGVDLGSGRGRARVADDWEERFVVREDLSRILGVSVKDVKDRLKVLSAAWETGPGIPPAVDPPLLGALDLDKARYRYVLRAELVFDLYQELGSDPGLLRGSYRNIVVDEYQDLNNCDVAVVDELGRRGARLYVAGDDDQSIYEQLRNARPQAIRDFVGHHPGAGDLVLRTCMRCDSQIITLAKEVITAEPGRIDKPLERYTHSGPGILDILTFEDQFAEARGIADLARKFVDAGVDLDEILVLLRSDHNGAFSSVIDAAFRAVRVPSIIRTAEKSALATKDGRLLLAHLRLLLDATDDLAWRTVLDCARNGIGEKTVEALHALAAGTRVPFAQAVAAVAADPTLIAAGGTRVRDDFAIVSARIATVAAAGLAGVEETVEALSVALPASDDLEAARGELVGLARSYLVLDLADFLVSIALKKEEEQSIVPETVNIMTMHKAKGLDACVVFVAGAEDELLIRDPADRDEARRLFYVSLTRAKHALFVSHVVRRRGAQGYSGGWGPRPRTSLLRTRGPSSPGPTAVDSFIVDPVLLRPLPRMPA